MKKFVVSDIHGQDKMLLKLLSHLDARFGDYKLYIIGDILDRGEGGYNIFKLITSPKYASKVALIKGNHEDMLTKFVKITDPQDDAGVLATYLYPNNGTMHTIHGIAKQMLEQGLSLDSLQSDTNCKLMCTEILATEFEDMFEALLMQHNVSATGYNIKLVASSVYDRLKEMADYFENLPLYAIGNVQGDNYLLVHSGHVNMPTNPEYVTKWNSPIVCQNIQQLDNQYHNVFLSLRVFDKSTGLNVMPDSRFDGHIIVGGHTAIACITGNEQDKSVLFNVDISGDVASIALDGTSYEEERHLGVCGQLNCLCLDDYSQIIVKNDEKLTFGFKGCPAGINIKINE